MNRGDVITRTVGGTTEAVTLPPININHLLTIRVEGGKVRGFHILPTSVVTISSTNTLPLPAGALQAVDSAGNPIAGAAVKLSPLRVPASAYDPFEAAVEVVDAMGSRIAYDPANSFYPQGWTQDQIEQAIYSDQGLDACIGTSVSDRHHFDWDWDGVSGPRTTSYFE